MSNLIGLFLLPPLRQRLLASTALLSPLSLFLSNWSSESSTNLPTRSRSSERTKRGREGEGAPSHRCTAMDENHRRVLQPPLLEEAEGPPPLLSPVDRPGVPCDGFS